MRKRIRNACAVALFCALAIPVSVVAQPSALSTLITVDVKADMVGEFEALQREYNAAAREAGVTQRSISQVVRGPASQYLILTPIAAFADDDGPNVVAQAMGDTGWSQWVARITKTVSSRRIDTVETRLDLSVPLADGRTPALLVLRMVENLPGRRPDFTAWLRDTWVPAVKAAGMDGVVIAQNVFGGSGRLWYQGTFVDNWATFDTPHPVRSDVGGEAWGQMMGTSGSMTRAPVVKVLRIRPDLSIQP